MAYVGVVFAGGITVGAGTYDLLPGRHEVSADVRSVDTEGVAAARWAARWLPPRGNFLADITDNELISAYSRLDPQSGQVSGEPVGELFVSPTFGSEERRIITVDKLRFLIVDRRDSSQLPRSGRYFAEGDPKTYTSPIPLRALTKFDSQPCIGRIFSSENIVIYDTSAMLRGCR